MFRTRQHIISAMEGVRDSVVSSSTSLISVDRARRAPDGDPFRPGFLAALEVRTELTRLLRGLDERSQRLLVLWFVDDRPVTEIASELGISRVHCYRLRNKALDDMLEASGERREAAHRAS